MNILRLVAALAMGFSAFTTMVADAALIGMVTENEENHINMEIVLRNGTPTLVVKQSQKRCRMDISISSKEPYQNLAGQRFFSISLVDDRPRTEDCSAPERRVGPVQEFDLSKELSLSDDVTNPVHREILTGLQKHFFDENGSILIGFQQCPPDEAECDSQQAAPFALADFSEKPKSIYASPYDNPFDLASRILPQMGTVTDLPYSSWGLESKVTPFLPENFARFTASYQQGGGTMQEVAWSIALDLVKSAATLSRWQEPFPLLNGMTVEILKRVFESRVDLPGVSAFALSDGVLYKFPGKADMTFIGRSGPMLMTQDKNKDIVQIAVDAGIIDDWAALPKLGLDENSGWWVCFFKGPHAGTCTVRSW